ncbi:DUF3823 domain-containing protein [Parafilimonas terrae]|uniref:DUF3823 domain-containing protein n=1 Tax=Parafilimonas terrae TaxID=1465490 RepID=A0A1I5WVH0_9BACT|nr:DUF3823 domain-containing protein [Parafilimonas terrae]SFQ23694.1 Protein of unknown function [Parafilimonas terrae]
MKTISYFSLILLMVAASACSKKDNYDPPKEQVNGAILYKGDSIYLEYNRVPYQFYQYGFGKVGPVEQTFTQSGVISSILFNGSYKFIVPNGQGPFLWPKTAGGAPDSLDVTVSGSQQLNIEVTPYYMVRNASISAGGGTVSGTCKIEKIVTDANAKDIESVTLYINKTQFVSGANNIASASVSGADITNPDNVSLSVSIPAITPAQNYVFARIGLKIAGVEDMIFSPLFKLNF